MKSFLHLIVALFTLVSAGSGTAQTTRQRKLSVREIAQRSFRSVVVLVTKDAKGKLVSLGSGFFVQPDVVVTNHHVVKNAEKILVRLVRRGDFCEASVVGVREDEDLALLFVGGIKAAPLPLAASQKLAVGDVVYVVGNPEGLEGTFSEGIVSGLRGDVYFQISAPISHGSSGGPVLNQRGEVVGIATLMSREGQNLNFAVRAKSVVSFGMMTAAMLYAARDTPTKKGNSRCGTTAATSANPTPTDEPEVDFVSAPHTTRFANSRITLDGKLAKHYIDFTFYYPATWQVDRKAGTAGASNFVKVERRLLPDFTQENFAVGWYASKGSFAADTQTFPGLVQQLGASLAESFPEYRKVSEGPTKVNSLDGYEFRFVSLSKGTEKGDLYVWGRVVFLPTGIEGQTAGATLIMLATSLAPELSGIDDVGVKGEMPVILESFRFGKNR